MTSQCLRRGGGSIRAVASSSSSSFPSSPSSLLFGMPFSSSSSSRAAAPSPNQFTIRTQSSRKLSSAGRRASSISALPGDGNSPSSSSFAGGIADAARRLARTAQGGLPIVGLLSRLAAPGGGVGWDELAYPEFARALVDADASGEASFSSSGNSTSRSSKAGAYAGAVLEWQERHGRMNGQARYVALYLWMAFSGGGGLVPARLVALSARRLAVTYGFFFFSFSGFLRGRGRRFAPAALALARSLTPLS